jgi:hypothetical protein
MAPEFKSAEDFAKACGEIKAAVDGVVKNSVTKSELDEKMALVTKELTELSDAYKKMSERGIGTTEPLEEVTLKMCRKMVAQGLCEVKDIVGVQCYEQDPVSGATTSTPFIDSDVRQALALADHVYIADQLMDFVTKGQWGISGKVAMDGGRAQFMERFPSLGMRWDGVVQGLLKVQGKAPLDSTTATAALEWVPPGFGSNLLDEVRLGLPETNLYPTINMPTGSWTLPMKTNVGQAYIRTEGVAPTVGQLSVEDQTWTAFEFANLQEFTNILDEDSIVAIVPEIRRDHVRSLGEGLCEAIVNGDVRASHIDFDTQSATVGLPENAAFTGLRQYALDDATEADRSVFAAGTTKDPLDSIQIAGGAAFSGLFGAGTLNQLVCLVSAFSWAQLLTDENMITVDKMGARATIVSGQIGTVFGIPIVLSNAVHRRCVDGVHTTGRNTTGQSNDLGMSVLTNRFLWRLGNRRLVTFEQDKDIKTGVTSMVATARWGFRPIERPLGAEVPKDAPHVVVLTDTLQQ